LIHVIFTFLQKMAAQLRPLLTHLRLEEKVKWQK